MRIKKAVSFILNKAFPGQMEERRHRIELKKTRDTRRQYLSRLQARATYSQGQWTELVKEEFHQTFGTELDLMNPQTFSEKVQWRKLYDHNMIYSTLTDKYAVREWIRNKIGEEYLIPLLGVWERAEDIDFDTLPDQFVLKTNNASSTNIIVRDKKQLQASEVRETLNYWLQLPFWAVSGEQHYKAIPPKILAESLISVTDSEDLPDYKFFCFHGEPCYCQIDVDRYHGHKRVIMSMDWQREEWSMDEFLRYNGTVEKPLNFEKMTELARKLSEDFSFVRVDLYNVHGTIYFGEMTFTPGSGLEHISPVEYDLILGQKW